MNYRQMEIFYAIMTLGSVTAAAKSLNLTQPAVTKILRQTEERLGFALFHRVKGRLVPTDDASLILHDVEQVFQDMSAVQQTVVNARLGRSGTLNIVSVPPFCQVLIPKAISQFLKERPNVQISFAQRDGDAAMRYVASERADIGFSFLVPIHSSVQATTILERDMVCIVPRDNPLAELDYVTAADLEDQLFISYPNDSRLRPLIESTFMSSRKKIPRQIQTTSIISTWALVQQGAGIGVVENISGLEELHDNIVMIPFSPAIPIQMEAVTPRTKPPSRLTQEFVKTVRAILAVEKDYTRRRQT